MLQVYLTCLTYVLICVFLVTFVRDIESRNDLFLAFCFSFFVWIIYQPLYRFFFILQDSQKD